MDGGSGAAPTSSKSLGAWGGGGDGRGPARPLGARGRAGMEGVERRARDPARRARERDVARGHGGRSADITRSFVARSLNRKLPGSAQGFRAVCEHRHHAPTSTCARTRDRSDGGVHPVILRLGVRTRPRRRRPDRSRHHRRAGRGDRHRRGARGQGGAGIELSAEHEATSVHVLCYWMDPAYADLQAELARLREERFRRGELMVEKLRALGVPIEFEHVADAANGATIVRPHVAQAMVEIGAGGERDRGVRPVPGRRPPRPRAEARARPSRRRRADHRRRRRLCAAHPGMWGDTVLGPGRTRSNAWPPRGCAGSRWTTPTTCPSTRVLPHAREPARARGDRRLGLPRHAVRAGAARLRALPSRRVRRAPQRGRS